MEIKIKKDCIEVDGEKYIKESKEVELEYLDGNGDWKPESNLGPKTNYRIGLRKLNYNFGGAPYYTSKTKRGAHDVIWRKKK